MISDPSDIGEHFHEYFINLGPNLADRIPTSLTNYDSYLGESNLNSIFLNAITIKEVAKEVYNLDANKSPGYSTRYL